MFHYIPPISLFTTPVFCADRSWVYFLNFCKKSKLNSLQKISDLRSNFIRNAISLLFKTQNPKCWPGPEKRSHFFSRDFFNFHFFTFGFSVFHFLNVPVVPVFPIFSSSPISHYSLIPLFSLLPYPLFFLLVFKVY